MTSHLFNGEWPPRGGQGPYMSIPPRTVRRIAFWGLIVLGIILLYVFLDQGRGVYTDWLWFGNLGFRSVFKTILVLRIWLFFAGTFLFLALLLVNVFVAYRFSRGASVLPVPSETYSLIRFGAVAAVVATVVIMGVVFGGVASSRWETFLVFFNQVSFGILDPQYEKDISFYVADLPLWHFIQGWFMGAVIAIVVAVIGFYLLMFTVRGISFQLTPKMRGHLAILGALLMVTIAAAHYLDTFEPLFSGGGAAFGASYVDVNARVPVLYILTGIALLSAVGFVTSIYFGGWRIMAASFGLWALFGIGGGLIYPALVQRFSVDPDEFNKEKPYIERNLEATRAAYNLEGVDERNFEYRPELTSLDVAENPQTVNNVRLWDTIPLTAIYNQVQFFELYYNFVDMDVDRYTINGDYQQVMLAGRELSPEDLPVEAQRWVNRKLQYTHGYGVAMSGVTDTTREGLPEFLLGGIPPVGDVDLERPQIYYGENTRDFVIVNTKTEEFDFPGPEGGLPARTVYQGSGGVPVGSFFRKVAYAWEFLDINILISNQLTSDSRVMYRRLVDERVSQVAPFLTLDKDPYLVVADGKLWWIADAYTTTDRYPYSAPSPQGFNYIRNSVKVVVDAYEGTPKFYVVDPDDPMVQIYQKAFPDLFETVTQPDPFEAIPVALRPHIRYPQDLFTVQARRYLQYHMRDPEEFFRKDKQWDFGNELFFNEPQPVRPYYVIMKLPGETEAEFVLIMPFTPLDKPNMKAWMAARSDFPHYGEVQTFIFSTEEVSGTEQVESRITNDDTIRERLTLLCPEETVVCIRGNLLVIPLVSGPGDEQGGTLLYVEPLFIRPVAQDFPQLKQVFVADGNSVVMASTLAEGIQALLGREVPPVVSPPGPLPPEAIPPEMLDRLQQVIDDFIRSQRESLDELQQELEGLAGEQEGSLQ